MKWIDRFAIRHPRFGIPNLMLYIVALNALAYVLLMFPQGGTIYLSMMFDRELILHGEIWRIFTYLFLPTDSSFILMLISLYFYWMIGSTLEREWGTTKFSLYYLIGWFLTTVVSFIFDLSSNGTYLNLSLFFAFASLYPDFEVLLFFFLPIKVKWLAVADAALFIFAAISSPWPFFMIPITAIGNYFLFFYDSYVEFFKRRKYGASRSSAFRKQVREGEVKKRNYTHKCCICGITDLDDPNMEFRYCSLCTGYKCYCQNHLFNHTHN